MEALVQAEAMLLTNQIAAGTLVVYERGLRYWRVWRVWRRRAPFLLGGREAREDKNELIRFVAYFGVVCEYANSTLHCWLHGIRHAHVVHGLGDPLADKLRLRMCRQGLKRLDKRRRGRTNKLAATVALLLELIVGGGLDFTTWDDSVLAGAAVFGFFKLRRSGEFLRKGEHPDVDKCERVGHCALAEAGSKVAWEVEAAAGADEAIAWQRFSKTDQTGQGVGTNTFKVEDKRLCVVAWLKHLLCLNPAHFHDPTRFLFTISERKVLSRDKMAGALKGAARRLGLKESEINVVSLRSGGATAMYHAGFSVEAIQRRGRWASDCWKIYVQDSRDTARDVAERMARASVTLL